MLSVLKKQAEQLEKELKAERLKHLRLAREHATCEASLAAKDERIAALEGLNNQLVVVNNQLVARSHSGKGGSADVAMDVPRPAPTVDAEAESALKAKILQLSDTIRQKDSKLCFEELARSMAELKLASSDFNMWKRLNEQSKALEEARMRIRQLQQAGGASEADELRLRIADLEDDVRRRDEQIEFLMHVHDAAHDAEWVQKWACDACTLLNAPTELMCAACSTPKP